jgi:hypothetical protein
MNNTRVSSGLPSLDQVIDDLRYGDNVVWQVDDIGSYRHFAGFFIQEALRSCKKLIYVRFGQHQAIVPDYPEVVKNGNFHKYELDAGLGFETFSASLQNIITSEGEGVCYVFDCLSDLLSEWSTDLMIGNFFRVTCPYLFKLNTIAYFAILRDRHSYQAIARIRETTQILLDVFHKDFFCIHPLKVWERYSPTMFLPHISTNGTDFTPLTSSAAVTEIYSTFQYKIGKAERQLDYWDRVFIEATELAEKARNGDLTARRQEQRIFEQLLRMIIGRDVKMQNLARRYFTIADLLQIKSRLIGSGFIGGKAVGLLLSRAILARDSSCGWSQILESHDSFYIGSDIYYTYLVENNCWQLRLEQKKTENYFSTASLIKDAVEKGDFPELIRDQFLEMLEYFGQAPIIVRSSSLLEDGFGNAFAGKYQSVFCANQGNLAERYGEFVKAVRLVYASTMNEDALAYRLQRGLAQCDEQMALLVQRVSGAHRRSYFFPDLAGVALSHNLYVWRSGMNPSAGMLRLVLGLGTRAVNRIGDDYARFVALDQPTIRPEASLEDQKTYSQHEMDLIDLEHNSLETVSIQNVINQDVISQLPLFASRDYSDETAFPLNQWYLNFETLLGQTAFPALMRKMLHVLQTAYGYPVDTEFTCNFRSMDDFSINILQCRPLQIHSNQKRITMPENISKEQIIFANRDRTMGGNLELRIKRLVYIVPRYYAALELSRKYEVARIIGKLNQLIKSGDELPTVLLGPGRLGTSTPSLGIPVSFAEINKFAVFGEIAFKAGGFIPELSYGTHFFQDIIENNNFYLIINEAEAGTIFAHSFFEQQPNQLSRLLPGMEDWQEVIRVIDESNLSEEIWIHAEVTGQKVICWRRS